MGAYENPAQLVDKQSGQLIGQAIASIGQNLAKGMDAQSKVYREMAERRRATLKANQERRRKRAISINKDIRDTNKNLPEKATKGGIQSAISNIPRPIEAYSRLDQGKNTLEDDLEISNFELTLDNAPADVSNTSATMESANTAVTTNYPRVDESQSSPESISYAQGDFVSSSFEYKKGKNSSILFNNVTFQDGTTASFQWSGNKANNNANYFQYGNGNIVMSNDFTKRFSDKFNADGEGKFLLKNKMGTSRFAKEEFKATIDLPTKTDTAGRSFMQQQSFPNTNAIATTLDPIAGAEAFGELSLNNGIQTGNAFINLHSELDDNVNEKESNKGIVGYINLPNYKSARDMSTGEYNPADTTKTPVYNMAVLEDLEGLKKDIDYKTLPDGTSISMESFNSFKDLLKYDAMKVMGAFDVADAPTSVKDRTYGPKDTGPTKAEYINSNLRYLMGLNTDIKDKNNKVVGKKYQSNIKDKVYKANEGGPGLINAIKNDPRYKGFENVIDSNYLPLVSGGDYEKRAEKQTKAAQTEVVFAELGLPRGTTLDSLKLTGPVAEGVALDKKAIEAKIKSKVDARMLIYKKNLDKGLIFNTRPSSSTPGQILTSEQFIRQLPNRLSAVTPKGAN
tara:strand:- start:2386 stop:4257 length:1872 start_codon:yes stop_codon:yes gene_type:complete